MLLVVTDLVVAELGRVHVRIVDRFTRSEPRSRAREYLCGLVAGLERKNGWTLAEQAGEVCPDGMQRLLRRADWDVDGVRDDLRDYVVECLGELAVTAVTAPKPWQRPHPSHAGRGQASPGTPDHHHPRPHHDLGVVILAPTPPTPHPKPATTSEDRDKITKCGWSTRRPDCAPR
jgi:hypothetical protein